MIDYDVKRMLSLSRVSAVVPSPDGTWAAVQVARLHADGGKYVSDLWRLPLADRDRPALRLTWGESDDTAPCFRADGALGFLSNRPRRPDKPEPGEDKRTQVWVLDAGGGEPRPLTDAPLGVSAFRFARRGDLLAMICPVLPGVPREAQRERAKQLAEQGPSALHFTRMPVRYWDHWFGPADPHLFVSDQAGSKPTDLTPDADRRAYREADLDVSDDGRLVVITAARPGPDRVDDRGLEVFEVATGTRRLLPGDARTEYGGPVLSPDGKQVVSTRERRFDDRAPEVTLFVQPTGGGAGRVLAADWDVWPAPSAFTADGQAVLCTASLKGEVPVFRVPTDGGEPVRITAASTPGTHAGVRPLPGTGRLLGLRDRQLHPPEVFLVDDAQDAVPELASSLSGFTEADGAALATLEWFTVEGAGGAKVDTLLLEPAVTTEKPPTLFWIHGGPISAFGDGWHWRWNPLVAVAAGYAVALPNPRGSTGYGQAFIDGIWRNRYGAECYEDLMAVADALEARPDLDPKRIAAMGGSFGGYMSNWIGGSTDRFRAIVTHASLFDFRAFYGVTDLPAYWALELEGTPYRDPVAFERYSPHTRVHKWKTPTLVIHGERDYRVPLGEGLALFEALQLHGVDSELLVFPDENHWILAPKNAEVWYGKIFEFLGRHLGA